MSDLNKAADKLDASTDRLALAMAERRKLLASLERVGSALLTVAERAALLALQAAINGAITKGG